MKPLTREEAMSEAFIGDQRERVLALLDERDALLVKAARWTDSIADAMRIARGDARRAVIDILLEDVQFLAGEATWRPVFEAVAARDARVRIAALADAPFVAAALEAARLKALEEAGGLAEDWTCKRCDSDTAGDLAMAIRQLAVLRGGER
jgi:hypothetical protein